MQDTSSCDHELNVSGVQMTLHTRDVSVEMEGGGEATYVVAYKVFVLERTFDEVGQSTHSSVRMIGESSSLPYSELNPSSRQPSSSVRAVGGRDVRYRA